MYNKTKKLQKIVLSGLFAAIAIVLKGNFTDALFSILQGIGFNMKVSLELAIIILAGFFMGPYYGASVGFIADIFGFILAARYGFVPFYTVAYTLSGYLPGLFAKYGKQKLWVVVTGTVITVYFYYIATTIIRYVTQVPPVVPPMSFSQFLIMRMTLTTFLLAGYLLVIIPIYYSLKKSNLQILKD